MVEKKENEASGKYLVSIPEGNGYRYQPDKIYRVIEHIRQYDETADLILNDGSEEYFLITSESKAWIVIGVIERQYGFVVSR